MKDTAVTTVSVWQFVIAVTASALAILLGTMAVEFIKNRSATNKRRHDLKTQLAIEYAQLSKLVDRLKIEYRARNLYPIGFIDLALSELLRIDDELKRASLLDDLELQKKLFELTTDARALITTISGNERFIVEPGIDPTELTRRREYTESQRPQADIDLSDLANRLSGLIRDLQAS